MNHTHIALLALLLPISGYTITKEERMREIEIQLEQLIETQSIILINLFAAELERVVIPTEEKAACIKACDTYEVQIRNLEKEYETLSESQEQK